MSVLGPASSRRYNGYSVNESFWERTAKKRNIQNIHENPLKRTLQIFSRVLLSTTHRIIINHFNVETHPHLPVIIFRSTLKSDLPTELPFLNKELRLLLPVLHFFFLHCSFLEVVSCECLDLKNNYPERLIILIIRGY